MERSADNTALSCRNCNTPLTGDYCGACGQRARELQMADVFGDALADLTDLDSRLWRTLRGLLLHPGQVSADYIAGRRARYIPPLRLYLVVSFLVFLVLSLTESGATLDNSEAFGEQREPGIYMAYTGEDGERQLLPLDQYIRAQGWLEPDSAVPEWLRARLERLASNAAALSRDPKVFTELLQRRIPQMMFVLLPLFALLLWLFYRQRQFHYLQHLMFSLHYHTLAFLLFLLLWPVSWLLPGDYGGVILLVLLVYLPLSLQRTYGDSRRAAVVRGLALGFIYYFLVWSGGALFALTTLALL